MGIRDFIKQKREQHGGLRKFAKSVLGAPPPGRETVAPAPAHACAGDTSLPLAPDEQGFVAVAASPQVLDGQGQTVVARGEPIALFRVEGKLFAIDNTCVHEDGPLGEGRVDGAVVTCPYHDWRYELSTGTCLSEPGRAVGCFQVREHDGFVWVGKRTSKSSSDRGGAHDDGMQVLVREV